MIERHTVEERIKQLQQERAEVVRALQRLHEEAGNYERLLHSYDGAIGELSALLQAAPVLTNEQANE